MRIALPLALIFLASCVTEDLRYHNDGPADVESADVAPDPVCGNGILEEGENCDLGSENGNGICPLDCIISDDETVCGDGFVSGEESCDDGINDGSYNSCTPECELTLRCGDGIVQAEFNEVCDDGINDGAYNGCSQDCSERSAYCGDGIVQGDELCDDERGPGAYNGCGADCASLGPRCGDGIVQSADEFCDDGVNDNSYGGCSEDCSTAPGAVLFSEIMYNTVGRDDFEERHEFIEIHNPNPGGENLNGWRIEGGVEFTFPGGTNLSGRGFIVIAKDRDALLALYPDLNPNLVVGNYAGTLKNGGEELTLVRRDDSVADRVEYDDDLPWPRGADGLGADERWLASVESTDPYRFKGRSLERVSFALGAQSPENWVASELSAGPSPGVRNPTSADVPKDVALDIRVRAADGERLIRAGQSAHFSANYSRHGALENVTLEYFVDALSQDNETRERVSLSGNDARAFTHVFDAFPERTLVRYRVLADRGDGEEVVSPRATDPQEWFAFYTSPSYDEFQTRTYDLIIDPERWGQAWNNLDANGNGRVNGCVVNPNWQRTVPATFVYEGHVYDVEVRFQGSRYQRFRGNDLANFDGVGPAGGAPTRTLSWRVQFPDYDRFSGQEVILLNKLIQSCNGVPQGVGFALFGEFGIPTPKINYTRLNINGGYFNYMLQLSHMNERTIEDFYKDYAERTGTEPQEVGHLYKAKGIHTEEGPYESGDGGLIGEGCGFSAAERYAATFDKKTHEWAGGQPLIDLITGLDAARTQGGATYRSFVEENFDVDTMLSHLAVSNFLAPWDDVFHNYYVYQRRDNGKWFLLPWDLDLTFGLFRSGAVDTSLFVGQVGDPDNRSDRSQFFKDAILSTHRDEYLQRVAELNQGILSTASLQSRIDTFGATAISAEAQSAPAGMSCDFDQRTLELRNWVSARHDWVQTQLP